MKSMIGIVIGTLVLGTFAVRAEANKPLRKKPIPSPKREGLSRNDKRYLFGGVTIRNLVSSLQRGSSCGSAPRMDATQTGYLLHQARTNNAFRYFR